MSQTPIVLVTGANRGLGFATVRRLAQRGAKVILTARDAAAGSAAVAKLAAEKLTAEFAVLDVTSAKSRSELAAELARRFGRLDVLINNAGINVDGAATAANVPDETLRATFATNTIAPLALTQAVLPLLEKSAAPRVISISSSMAASGNTMLGYPAYRVAKAALNSVVIQLAAELGPKGFAVNAVCPGWLRTDLGGPHAPKSADEGADTPVWLALDAPQSLNGKFVSDRQVIGW